MSAITMALPPLLRVDVLFCWLCGASLDVITASLLDVDANTLERDQGLEAGIASDLRGFVARAVNGEVPWNR